MLFSHVDSSVPIEDVPAYGKTIYVTCRLTPSEEAAVTAGRLMWFQRLTSPLDDVLNQKAVGIALYPEQDNFNLSIDHLFPVIWLAEYDRYPVLIRVPKPLDHLASFANDFPDALFILALGTAWNLEHIQELHERNERRNILLDVSQAVHLIGDLMEQIPIPTLNVPPTYYSPTASEAEKRLMQHSGRRVHAT